MASALYTKGPTEEEAAAFGLTLEEAGGGLVEVWPDNLSAVNVFICISTQWRVSMNGPTGLDYVAIPEALRMMNIGRSEWPAIFEDIRTMEDAALATMRVK